MASLLAAGVTTLLIARSLGYECLGIDQRTTFSGCDSPSQGLATLAVTDLYTSTSIGSG